MTLTEFKDLNANKGKFFFSPDTMRFFKSSVEYWDAKTGFFVTSEKAPLDTKLRYTVRKADFETAEVETIGQFQQYKSLSTARAAIIIERFDDGT